MNELATSAHDRGRSMTGYGIAAVILGIFAMLAPVLTGFSIAFLVGGLVLLGGLVRMIWALQAKSFGRGLLAFAVGGLTLLCGIALLAHPLFSAAVLTVVLTIYFLADGITEVLAGLKVRPIRGWGWLVCSGVVSILFGVVMWQQYPLSGPWAIGILLGIRLFMSGLVMITGGSVLKSAGQELPARE